MNRKGPIRRFNILLCFFAASFLLCSCSKKESSPSSVADPALFRQYRKDSATVIVSVSKTNITTSGSIRLMLDIHAPEKADVVSPEIDALIEPFSIAKYYFEPPQTLPNGKILHRTVWHLVPGLPGTVIFPPLEIFVGTTLIKTQPISIEVCSVLPEGLDVFEIKDISAPVIRLPEQIYQHRLWKVLTGTTIALVCILFGIRRRRNPKQLIEASPYDTAIQALENLPTDPVPRIHELNYILRKYIEPRFGLPMIGKTTAEILPVLRNTELQGLTPKLMSFLETGEQVRFSNRVPSGFTAEAEQFVHEFVESTKPGAEPSLL